MSRPRIYHSEEERAAARAESRRKWREAHPERWRAILAKSYLRRKKRGDGLAARRLGAPKVRNGANGE